MAGASKFCKICDERLETQAEQDKELCNQCDEAIDKLVEKRLEDKRVGFTSGAHTLRKEGQA